MPAPKDPVKYLEWKTNLGRAMSIALKGKKRAPFSSEWRQNMSLARKRLGIQPPHFKGEDHYRWRGGITPLTVKIRNSARYCQWRTEIFTRDDFTCQECGSRGVKLNADHIKSFSDVLFDNKIATFEQALDCTELWNLANGRTLCVPCHSKTINFGRKLYWNALKIAA